MSKIHERLEHNSVLHKIRNPSTATKHSRVSIFSKMYDMIGSTLTISNEQTVLRRVTVLTFQRSGKRHSLASRPRGCGVDS